MLGWCPGATSPAGRPTSRAGADPVRRTRRGRRTSTPRRAHGRGSGGAPGRRRHGVGGARDLGADLLLGGRGQEPVRIGVVRHDVTGTRHGRDQLGVRGCLPADDAEGGADVEALQQGKHLRGPLRIRSVVDGEGHVGGRARDVGLRLEACALAGGRGPHLWRRARRGQAAATGTGTARAASASSPPPTRSRSAARRRRARARGVGPAPFPDPPWLVMTALEVTQRNLGTPRRAELSSRGAGASSALGGRLLLRHCACRLRPLLEQPAEARLVEDRHAELAGLVGLGARRSRRRRRSRSSSRRCPTPCRRAPRMASFASSRLKPSSVPGDDDGQPLERARDGLVALVLHPDAGSRPPLDDPPVPVDVEPLADGLGDDAARRRRPPRAPRRSRSGCASTDPIDGRAPAPPSGRRGGSTGPRAPATAAGPSRSRRLSISLTPFAESSPSLRVYSGTRRRASASRSNRSPSSVDDARPAAARSPPS